MPTIDGRPETSNWTSKMKLSHLPTLLLAAEASMPWIQCQVRIKNLSAMLTPTRSRCRGLFWARADSPLDPMLNRPIQRSLDVPSSHPSSSPLLLSTASRSPQTPAARTPFSNPDRRTSKRKRFQPSKPADPLMANFTGSDLLGGTLTLSDLDSPAMPPLARSERARWSRSGDPMAPLPATWRDPVRKALDSLPNPARHVAPARVVHVPSTRVTRSTSVPLAIQSDGSVDILTQPDSPEVVKEIESWSNRQSPPPQNTVAPAVVHLEPLPEDPKPLSSDSQAASTTERHTPPVTEQRPIKPLPQAAPIQTSHHHAGAASPSPAVAPAAAAASPAPSAAAPISEELTP